MGLQNKIRNSVVASLLLLSSGAFAMCEIVEPTGLDQIIQVINEDSTLNKKVEKGAIEKVKVHIDGLNTILREAVLSLGVANDGFISIGDTLDINSYIVKNHSFAWREHRGVRASKSGYYLVEGKGSQTIAMNGNAINIWGSVYDLGFPSKNGKHLTKEDGTQGISFDGVAWYLNEILKKEIESGSLYRSDFVPFKGDSGTSLDTIVEAIIKDPDLNQRIATSQIVEGAKAADEMNKLLVEAIKAEGLTNDGSISTADARSINLYLVKNHKERWAELHGDDAEGAESGFHLVQNDGAYHRMFADNVVNSIADGIYHLGFPTTKDHLLVNEDGNANKSFEKVAWWLNEILAPDLDAKILQSEYKEVAGSTETSLDQVIAYIYNDEGLLLKISTNDIRAGAKAADEMNKLIVLALKETRVANDGYISEDDVKVLNSYLSTHYAQKWAELHGDDAEGAESGFHLVQNDGARGIAYNNKNVINNLADGVYHLGFPSVYKFNLANEDGNKNASFASVAYWMNMALKEDIAKKAFD